MVGTPSILVPPPCGFGISTARTGGGNQVPEDIRFPDLVQVVLQVGLERLDRYLVHARRTLVRLDLLPGLLDRPLRNVERLARRLQLVHTTPPEPQRVSG